MKNVLLLLLMLLKKCQSQGQGLGKCKLLLLMLFKKYQSQGYRVQQNAKCSKLCYCQCQFVKIVLAIVIILTIVGFIILAIVSVLKLIQQLLACTILCCVHKYCLDLEIIFGCRFVFFHFSKLSNFVQLSQELVQQVINLKVISFSQ